MESFLDSLKNLGAGRLATMLAAFFGLIIFFIFIAARSSTPGMTLLYSDLSTADSTEVTARLDTVHIPYQLSADGKQVMVPQKEVGKARMLLAQDGLPHQGSVGYEIFDRKEAFGTTSFQQNINALRALEGELARTVGSISQVRSARVHLVVPQREIFSRETQPASASVFINLRNNQSLGQEQVYAIQHLISASVAQLKPSNVAIIDQNGNLLAKGDEGLNATDGISASTADEMKRKYEMRLARSIEEMIGRVVGYGRVRVNVAADLNFDVLSRNSESYNPDGQVVRSTQNTTENSSETSASENGGVSVENNLPGLPNSSTNSNNGSKSNRTEETTNYEISKTVESLISESGKVKKQSIAVLVDGKYETDTTAKKPDDMKEEDWQAPKKYIPRSQEELDQISSLVKSAVGFDENRGDMIQVVNMPFANDDLGAPPLKDDSLIMGFPKADLLSAAQTLSLSIVAVLVILLVLKPLTTHLTGRPRIEGESSGLSLQDEAALLAAQAHQHAQLSPPPAQAALENDSMIDMGAVEGKVKASSIQKVSELVTSHPSETVSVIRQWMSQEG